MLEYERLGAAVRSIRPVAVNGVYYRLGQLLYLLRDRQGPLSTAGSLLASGRFHHKDHEVKALYLGDSPYTCLLENGVAVAIPGEQDTVWRPNKPLVLYSVQVDLHAVLDLSRDDVLARLGTSFQEVTGSWRVYNDGREAPTQLLGRAAYESGCFEGVVYPCSRSLSDPTRYCLVVFWERLQSDSELIACDGGYLGQYCSPDEVRFRPLDAG